MDNKITVSAVPSDNEVYVRAESYDGMVARIWLSVDEVDRIVDELESAVDELERRVNE